MVNIFFKIKKFDSFTLFTEEATEDDIKVFSNENLSELRSDSKTSLGFNEEKQTYFIYEWKTYELKAIEDNPFNEKDYFFKGNRNTISNTATLRLENFVGLILFREQLFEVHSDKLSYEKVQELVEYVDDKILKLSLKFNSNAISKNRFIKDRNESSDFDKFIYLYHLMKTDKLLNAFQLILRNPYQHFQSNVEVSEFALARQFTFENMMDTFSGISPLVKCSRNLPIVKKLRGFIPEKINEYEKKVSNDNNENQFVLFFLKQCIKIFNVYIEKFSQFEEKEKIVSKSFILELKSYKAQLSRITKSRFFQDVGRLSVINRSSTVLTKRAGYKQLYNFYLNMKSVPKQGVDENDFVELFENKSIDKLFEYVTLFYLDDFLKEIYGVAPQEEKLSVSHKNYSIILDESNDKIKYRYSKDSYPTTTLFFQRSYTRKQSTSYAITQKPDFSLLIEYNGKGFLYHFDTKFKMKVFDVAEDNLSEQKRYAKEEDLKSMHAYKDGIKGTIGSYVIYPGNGNSEKHIYTDSRILNSTSKSINPYFGIGSIPLLIGEENMELKQFLKSIIEYHLINT